MKIRVLKYLMPALIFCGIFTARAVPAKPGPIRISQPDGSVVTVYIRGDEAGHIMTSPDGCSLVRDNEGYLCYAAYSADGARLNSGVRYGHDPSGQAVAASREIPYGRLSRLSADRRRAFSLRSSAIKRVTQTRASGVATYRAVILLAQFPDLKFRFKRSDFEELVNQKAYNVNGASGSVLDYFNAQFKDAAEFQFEVGPVVTLPKGYAYYGEDDKDGEDLRAHLAVADACRLSDSAVDFSKYDYVYVFYAGGNPADGGASDDHIWPQSWSLDAAGVNLVLDGRRITDYSMSSELMNVESAQPVLTSIGTFCHEYSHILGLPDMYDTDYEKSSGQSDGLWGSTCLMDSGNYNNNGKTPPNFNALELMLLGLLEPENIHSGDYILAPMNKIRRALRMDTDTEDEFYLFETRQATGWDSYIGGSGLLVYHIDMTDRDAGYSTYQQCNLTAKERWTFNEINCRPDHQCADLVEADPNADDVPQVFFPSGKFNSLSAKTHKSYVFWSGATSALTLSNVRRNAGTVYFTVNGPLVIDVKDAYQDAVILNWHTDLKDCADKPVKLSWSSAREKSSIELSPYEAGHYSYTIEGLSPDTEYDITVAFTDPALSLYSASVKVVTKAYGGLPFIYLNSASRNQKGLFTRRTRIPLRVYNAREAKSVKWFWDGNEITADNDGYYMLQSDGRLKAVVTRKDGTEMVLVKDIFIR